MSLPTFQPGRKRALILIAAGLLVALLAAGGSLVAYAVVAPPAAPALNLREGAVEVPLDVHPLLRFQRRVSQAALAAAFHLVPAAAGALTVAADGCRR